MHISGQGSRWLVLAFALALVSGCQTLKLDDSRKVRYERSVVDGGGPERQRAFDTSISPPIAQVWRYNAAAGFGPGSPLVYGDAVIFGNRHGELHAVRFDDGRKIGMRTIGESLEGALMIQDERVFIPNAWGKWVLTSYDLLRGERSWRVRGEPIESAPVLSGGNLIAVDVAGNVRAFDPNSGAERWTWSLGEKASGETSPVALDDTRVFVVSDHGVAALLASDTGRVVWKRSLGLPVYASPSATQDLLLVPTTRGQLLAVSSLDGSIVWKFDVGNPEVRLTPPATDGESIYLGTSNGTLYRLDAGTGAVRWQFEAPDAIVAPPTIVRETLYVGTMGRMLYAFDRANGDLTWEKKLDGRIKSGMTASDGRLIVLAEPRYVYAFKTEASDAGTR